MLRIAKREEETRYDLALLKRASAYQRGGRKAEARMKRYLEGIVESLRWTVDKMGQGEVKGFRYPDGRVVGRLILDIPRWGSVRSFLLKVWEKGWWQFPAGTWFEGSLLYPPSMDPFNGKKKDYLSKYAGQQQAQLFPTRDPARMFDTIRGMSADAWSLYSKMKETGFTRPSQVMFRVGRSYDDSKPFKKKKPPVPRKK